MYLVPVESQSLAVLEREIIVLKSIIYVSETVNQHSQHPTPPPKPTNNNQPNKKPNPQKTKTPNQKNYFMDHDFGETTTHSLG